MIYLTKSFSFVKLLNKRDHIFPSLMICVNLSSIILKGDIDASGSDLRSLLQ
jgi:hypothetical protein